MAKKLFGGSGKGRFAAKATEASFIEDLPEDEEQEEMPRRAEKSAKKQKKKRSALKIWSVLLAIVLVIESAYCVVIFTDLIPPLAKLRTMYIGTAMSTMSHQYLAKALIPGDIVMDIVRRNEQALADQVGVNSGWADVTEPPTEETKSPSSGFSKEAAASMLSLLAQDIGLTSAEDDFFELFHELDEASTRAYVEAHPEVISAGWDKFTVNEAGLDDEGTDIYTKQGDQVLAVDAQNGLLVIRVTGSGYRGVLVLGKDPSRLQCAPSEYYGGAGNYAGEIAQSVNGLAAITGSGFNEIGPEGSSQAGGSMSSGVANGYHYPWGYKRIELHRDNRLYLVDAHEDYSADCTDATEWSPALIVDGVDISSESSDYQGLNPRACIGQTKDEAIMFLGIEGRYADSLGCSVTECTSILMRYNGYQAMNLDGGSSATVWYQGESIMRCGNGTIEGRGLPNAWVYGSETVPDPA